VQEPSRCIQKDDDQVGALIGREINPAAQETGRDRIYGIDLDYGNVAALSTYARQKVGCDRTGKAQNDQEKAKGPSQIMHEVTDSHPGPG
jgi:hypothetical protein